MKGLMAADIKKIKRIYKEAKEDEDTSVIAIIENIAKYRGIDLNAEENLEADKE